MNLSFDLLSILLAVTLIQGVFILSVLAIRYSLKPGQHLLLFLMVLALIWYQAEFLSVRLPYEVRINLFYGTRFGSWFLLGPLYYFYVQFVMLRSNFKPVVAALHFAPFVIFVFIIPLLSPDFLSFRQVTYGMLTSFDSFNDSVSFLQYLYSSVFVIQFVHFLTYLILTYKTTLQFERTLKGNYSSINTATLMWITTFNVLLLLVLLLVSLFLLLFFLNHSYNRNLDYLYVLPSTILIYLISYKLAGVQWPLNPVPDEKLGKYENSSLKQEQALRHVRTLEEFMILKKPYLDNELRLPDLAERLGIPPHHLSQVINDQLQTTFFDYINGYRVETAKELIRSDGTASLLEIAFTAGFNNKTSFTNAFKKRVGLTPVQYRQQQKSLPN